MLKFSPDGRTCSFCGFVGGPRSRFAGGYGALICAECVAGYHDQFQRRPSGADSASAGVEEFALDTSEHGPEEGEVLRPRWEAMDTADLLDLLATVHDTEQQATRFLHEWIALLRLRQATWTAIGSTLGVSRQAAWERFHQPRA